MKMEHTQSRGAVSVGSLAGRPVSFRSISTFGSLLVLLHLSGRSLSVGTLSLGGGGGGSVVTDCSKKKNQLEEQKGAELKLIRTVGRGVKNGLDELRDAFGVDSGSDVLSVLERFHSSSLEGTRGFGS